MLPFTADQFFDVFAEYNRTLGPGIGLFWLASAAGVFATWRDPMRQSRWLSFFLAALWLWNALAYHAWLFTRINPAAWAFAGVFLGQAILFLRAAARPSFEYFSAKKGLRRLGLALACYALAYPSLNMMSGHAYPATPTFGVPCPTTLLTIGLLVSVRQPLPLSLVIVPVLWTLIGGSAAWLLGVWSDYPLLIAGLFLAGMTVRHRAQSALVARKTQSRTHATAR